MSLRERADQLQADYDAEAATKDGLEILMAELDPETAEALDDLMWRPSDDPGNRRAYHYSPKTVANVIAESDDCRAILAEYDKTPPSWHAISKWRTKRNH